MTAVLTTEAGTVIDVGIAGRFEDVRKVRIDLPESAHLTADEGRRLAILLLEHAAEVERRNRRRAETGMSAHNEGVDK